MINKKTAVEGGENIAQTQENKFGLSGIVKNSKKTASFLFLMEHYIRVLAVIWTIIIASSLVWSIVRLKRETIQHAYIQAHISYVKDIVYRRWNAMHGGVYVPATGYTPPNPLLTALPERDIRTPSGRLLTLINPAYMTRQVYGMMKEEFGVRGHITSLKPIRPENSPDPWEKEALAAFEHGKTEMSSISKIEDKEYFRLMHVFITEKGCLKCHAKQGYREGDIRGGISVSIPIGPLRAIEHRNIFTFAAVHGLLWFAGLVGINLSGRRIRRSEIERMHAERELRETTNELARSNADLKQFAYAASHDLQEPLRTIAGFVKLLEKRYKGRLDADADDYISYTVEGVRRMQALIKDLLEYSLIETKNGGMKPADVTKIVEHSVSNLRRLLDESGAVVTHDNLPTVTADETQLVSLFQNLIDNAVKFRSSDTPRIDISAERKRDGWVFYVKDNGIGIDPRHAERIFVIFQRLHGMQEYHGTGIGLAICKKIVERHGGRLWVNSEPGKGSTFCFTIPAAEAPVQSA